MANSVRHDGGDGATLFQDEISYECVEGYEITGGPLTRTCLDTRVWSGSRPVCSGKTQNLLVFVIHKVST